MRHKYTIKARHGFTISEVVIASLLLLTAVAPILNALTSAQTTSTIVDHKSHSLILAREKMEDIRARAIYAYSASYAASSLAVSGSYLCTVTDSAVTSNLRRIAVSTGYDDNGDHTLSSGETQVTLTTLIAKRM
ncbi:MAG: hypothetical protein Q7T18_00115 [Sedimentisphaerales bacterium]|nr:hypothetical protein [Sedimentisphaerales bacterium]